MSGYGKSGFLDRIEQTFDWSAFERLLAPIHASARGAPGWPPFVMFKILLLQQWHALSDPGAEEAVRDRLLFRRFCGLPLEVETPDHASIWRFRQTIDKLGLSAALLGEVNRQLDALGLVVKRGTLVDATLIAGAVRRPYEGGGVNPRDPDAHFSRKRDKTYFGIKAHLAVDEESGLVRKAEMTSANVRDSRLGEALIQGDERGYFADKAYDSQALRETLERRGLVDGIAWKVKHSRYPLEPLAKIHQRLGGQHPLRRRARLRHDEALVRNGPRPLSGARAQRLPPSIRRGGDEHETGARPHGQGLNEHKPALRQGPSKLQNRSRIELNPKASELASRSPRQPFAPPNSTTRQTINSEKLSGGRLRIIHFEQFGDPRGRAGAVVSRRRSHAERLTKTGGIQ